MSKSDYQLTGEETAFLEKINNWDGTSQLWPDARGAESSEAIADIVSTMVKISVNSGPDAFLDFYAENREVLFKAAFASDRVVEALVLCLKLGIGDNHGPSANDLGALYYLGELVEQDYVKAAELYEMAAEWDCYQSLINLGYIYEYGRIGEPDYQKAFQYYSLAAALTGNYEAIYKLGDMFSRGRAVKKDIKHAYELWEKSYNRAQCLEEEAQAAIRIAPLLLNQDNIQYGIEYDPLKALFMYQIAEIGLRQSIAQGYTYYEKRLKEAIAGQEQARAILDMPEIL